MKEAWTDLVVFIILGTVGPPVIRELQDSNAFNLHIHNACVRLSRLPLLNVQSVRSLGITTLTTSLSCISPHSCVLTFIDVTLEFFLLCSKFAILPFFLFFFLFFFSKNVSHVTLTFVQHRHFLTPPLSEHYKWAVLVLRITLGDKVKM